MSEDDIRTFWKVLDDLGLFNHLYTDSSFDGLPKHIQEAIKKGVAEAFGG
jgi:hypothetical protein